MPSKFGGIAVDTPVKRSRFGGVPVETKTGGALQGIQAELNRQRAGTEAERAARPSLAEGAIGALEVGKSIVAGAVAEPIAGLAGIISPLNPFTEGSASSDIEETRQAITQLDQPQTPEGKRQLAAIGEALSPIGEFIREKSTGIGDFVLEATGSQQAAATAAATAETAPTFIMEMLGLGAISKLRRGAKLLDADGQPTLLLQKTLDKQGLVFENLTPEARLAIPERVTPNFIRVGLKNEIKGPAEKILIEQIKAGGSDGALANLKVVDNKIAPDNLGVEAVKQWADQDFVQMVKTADAPTKNLMQKMLTSMKRIKNNKRVSQELRPSDIVGDAVTDRITFIRDKANSARIELNQIAHDVLPGKSININKVRDAFQKSMEDLDIRLEETPSGIPKPIFKESLVSADPTSQGIIKSAIRLMSEGGAPDAIRAHKLKIQLDRMIDFRKKSAGGLTDAGRDVLKDMRRALNESIREVSPDYARVNDVMSSSLSAMDDFQKAVGTTIDIFGEGANKAIGTTMKKLTSNQTSRIRFEDALNTLDDTANGLGGSFQGRYKDLNQFATQLDKKFGAVATTSLQGTLESAASSTGVKDFATREAAKKVKKGFEKIKGVTDFNAFKSMNDLLKR